MNYHSHFMRRSRDIHRHMQDRFAAKLNKKGKLIRVGRPVPFTLEQFRAWLLDQFTSVEAAIRCAYDCGAVLDILSFHTDHKTPITRGGTLDLDNLALCCDECNRIKGELTAREYVALRQGLETFSEPARKDIYKRLKMGAGFLRLRFFNRSKKQKGDTSEGLLPGTQTQAATD
jgi:5-methylcytosine-specific restriction endonuclease McrA